VRDPHCPPARGGASSGKTTVLSFRRPPIRSSRSGVGYGRLARRACRDPIPARGPRAILEDRRPGRRDRARASIPRASRVSGGTRGTRESPRLPPRARHLRSCRRNNNDQNFVQNIGATRALAESRRASKLSPSRLYVRLFWGRPTGPDNQFLLFFKGLAGAYNGRPSATHSKGVLPCRGNQRVRRNLAGIERLRAAVCASLSPVPYGLGPVADAAAVLLGRLKPRAAGSPSRYEPVRSETGTPKSSRLGASPELDKAGRPSTSAPPRSRYIGIRPRRHAIMGPAGRSRRRPPVVLLRRRVQPPRDLRGRARRASATGGPDGGDWFVYELGPTTRTSRLDAGTRASPGLQQDPSRSCR